MSGKVVPSDPASARVTEHIWLCPDGVYRWTYEMHLMRNPTIFLTVCKVLGISLGVVFLFNLIVGLAAGDLRSGEAWLGLGKLFLILIGIFLVLGLISYGIVAAIYGGKYQVLFEMTEEYVRHIQAPKQVQKAQALGWLTMLAGAAAGKPAVSALGWASASRFVSTSEFRNVKVVKVRRRRNTIHVNQLLDKNQVYAEDADFNFVEQFIRARCVNARMR